MLNFNEYRDNNNYIYYNKVRTVDSRWLSLADTTYEFIDFDAKPVWIGAERLAKRNVTFDGINYHEEQLNQLLGTYYFYNSEKIEHLRLAMSLLTVGAKVGGLKEILFLLLGSFAFFYNDKLKVAFMLNKFYFHENQTPIKFSFKEVIFSTCYRKS